MAEWRWPNFTASEMSCRCGCGMLPPDEFMDRLQALRTVCGFPFTITSGARCPDHNAKVSATKSRTGPHTIGAADIAVSHEQAYNIIRHALNCGVTGLGVDQKGGSRIVHVDWLPGADGQPRPHIWSY